MNDHPASDSPATSCSLPATVVADVEAYHHRGPRPNLLACQSITAGPRSRVPRASERKRLRSDSLKTRPSRKHRGFAESHSSHRTMLRHSDIFPFDHVLSTFPSLGTTRTHFVFFRYPPCLAIGSHMPSLASSLLRRFHKRTRASYAHAILGRDTTARATCSRICGQPFRS